MPKAQRRLQLLETASAIVRAQGTDALTLAYLAERAGVTKPIAYEHFGTRAGLLVALYRHYDDRQTQAVRLALEAQARGVDDVIGILSAAYIDCALSSGPEFGAIAAALSGTEEMAEVRQSLRDGYVEAYRSALTPFATPPTRAVMLGVIGAAESLSEAAANRRLSRAQAVDALSRILRGAVDSD